MRNCRNIFSGIIVFIVISMHGYVHAQNVEDRKYIDTATINYQARVDENLLNPDSAIVLYKKLVQQSIVINYPEGAFNALMQMSIIYREKDDYRQTMVALQQALGLADKVKRKDALAWVCNDMGDWYVSQGNYTVGAAWLYKGLDAMRKVKGTYITAANITVNLGDLYERLNQPQKALTFLNEAERICLTGKQFEYQLAAVYLNKGTCYLDLHQADTGRYYFEQALTTAKQANVLDLISAADNGIGAAFVEDGEYEKALPYLYTAINISKNNYHQLTLEASYTLGEALLHMQRYKDAEAILVTALKETQSVNTRDNYIKCYTKLIEVYKATGQYQKAMQYMDSVTVLKDTMLSAENAKAISQMEIKYKTAEKDKELVQNQLLITKQKNKLAQKNMLIALVVAGVMLLLLLLWLRYRNARNKERLQAEEIKALQHQNTISILRGVVQGEESERGRLARELHDGIGGMLSAAMMRFMTIRHANETITKIPAYQEAMAMLDEIGDDIRKTAHNLMPTALLKQSLPDAVRSYCSSVEDGKGLQVDFQCYGEFGEFSRHFKLNVYRIIQELLKNIVAHASATRALVQLIASDHLMTLTVEDDGHGFSMNEEITGIGLHNLQTRVQGLHGHCTIESEAGKGTSVFIEFDLAMLPETTVYENQGCHS